MKEEIELAITKVQNSDLSKNLKKFLIEDIKHEGLTSFIKEQIEAYDIE